MVNKICNLEELTTIVASQKNKGMRIGATSGCFDILHAGHVTYLEEAKKLCDVLIVMLNADKSVKRLKGNERPIVPQDERATVLAALASVDFVCIFEEDTPCPAYRRIQPDYVIKGGDYKGKTIPECACVAEYGGKVIYTDMLPGKSSSSIIERIKQLGTGEHSA